MEEAFTPEMVKRRTKGSVKSIRARKANKGIPNSIKAKRGWKGLLAIIWTGIFILSSCIIVRGTYIMGEEFQLKYEKYEDSLLKNLSVGLLKSGSPFFQYASGPIEEGAKGQDFELKTTWSLAAYLEELQDKMALADAGAEEEREAEKSRIQQEILQKDFPFIIAECYFEDEETEDDGQSEEAQAAMASAESKIKRLKESLDTDYLIKNFYVVDSTTSIDASLFQVEKILERDMTLKKSQKPQILIYHTHGATEGFTDSDTGKEVSIIKVGERLAEILEEDYGYQVIHDDTPYDMVDGAVDRNRAYNQSLAGVKKTLEKYPSIKVVIDLHRDGIGSKEKRTTVINGKETARFMLFNGLSRNKEGAIAYLANPNLEGNLAFSLQVKLKAMELYPDLTRANYLKGYRYNLHLLERSLLIELGNQNNSSQEAMNSLGPMAEALDAVLMGK